MNMHVSNHLRTGFLLLPAWVLALGGCAGTPPTSAGDKPLPIVVDPDANSGTNTTSPAGPSLSETNGDIVGIDISKYQGNRLDFRKIRQSGKRYVFIRAMQGSVVDPDYANNVHRARCAGLVVGSYHFFRPHLDPKVQFEAFSKVVDVRPGDLPPVIDVEVTENAKKTRLDKELKFFIGQLQDRYHARPIIYSTLTFFNANVDGLSAYPIWLAEYRAEDRFKLPRDWKTWTFWQYEEGKREANAPSTPDLNRFNGDLQKFQTMLIGPSVPTEANQPVANCPAT